MGQVSSTRQKAEERLRAIGSKRTEHLRLRKEASDEAAEWVPAAIAAGVPITQVAELANLTRASVYTIIEKTAD